MKSGRVLRLQSTVGEDQTAQQSPTQKVQESKPKGPYLARPSPSHDDEEAEPDHVRTVTLSEDDQAEPSISRLSGVPVEEVLSEGDTEEGEPESTLVMTKIILMKMTIKWW